MNIKIPNCLHALALLVLFSGTGIQFNCEATAPTYSPCSIPPIVGSASRPNVMLVLDYSGSMQFPAYYDVSDA